MGTRKQLTLVTMLLATGAVVGACDGTDQPSAPEVSPPLFHVGCVAGEKFTGGGRIDPPAGKTTFGFNVHAEDFCPGSSGPIKGQLQVVHHPSKTRIHSISITEFASFQSPDDPDGRCAEFSGRARVKHGNTGWHEHDFAVEACDNGEPGSSPGRGPDTFNVTISSDGDTRPAHGTTGRTPLTGGNIQAH